SVKEFRVQFGDKHADRYEYQPIVRAVQVLEDTESYFPTSLRQVQIGAGVRRRIPTFTVFDKKDRFRTEVALNSFKEALQYIRYMTKHRMVINFSQLYAMKTSSGTEKKKYGVVLKAIAIECSNKTVPKYDPCAVLFD
ncbi:MAG: hypothetical protein ACKPKO_44330, partial [Candidatus Fonsibacter sp.]